MDFSLEMEKVMRSHDPVKGDTWKTCREDYLDEKLREEYHEARDQYRHNPGELIDLSVIAMMLWTRQQKK